MLDSNSGMVKHKFQNLALIILSVAFLPLDTAVAFWSLIFNHILPSNIQTQRNAIRQEKSFQPKTVLVTGVGMTKGLVLARLFYQSGHNVIGADFESNGELACGRVSRSLTKFVRLQKPTGRDSTAPYVQSLLSTVAQNHVDLWVSCSGVASAVEDGEAKEIIERMTTCKAVQFDVLTTQVLHEKHSFIEHTREIGLPVPETHTITNRALVDEALRSAPEGRKYIMKTIGMDDANRGDMTLLPKSTVEETAAHLNKLSISKESPWILQQFIRGSEFCTHALVIRGHVKAFVACHSAELLMHYQALPAESRLSQAMLNFTKTYAAKGGPSFTGHLSFDFLIEHEQLDKFNSNETAEITLYPIECNPRAHTAVTLFNGTTEMTDAYLSLLAESDLHSPYAEAAANGTSHDHVTTPRFHGRKYFWIGHDLVNLVLQPLLTLVLLRRDESIQTLMKGIDILLDRLLFWRDGTWEYWDPLPWWWLYHVYWPWQFLLCLCTGKKWSRVNVSTCKMFEC